MRILVAADIHYDLRQFDWLLSVAEDHDVLCLAGDLLHHGSAVSPRAQLVVVRSYLERLSKKTKLLVCSGDHDLTEIDRNGELFAHWVPALTELGIVPDGDTCGLDTTLISVLPWWDGRDTRSRVAAQLARDAESVVDRWIWLHHAPPSGSPVSWNGQRYQGDTNLLEWIALYGPNAVFTGHVHDAPLADGGSWHDRIGRTLVVNAGRQSGDVPAHVVYDVSAGSATWVTNDTSESTPLDE